MSQPAKHTYEDVEGTEPDVDEQHQPRTTKHFVDDVLVHMMTEIGDGTFVAWSSCRACKKDVKDCGCTGGPAEPEYMMKWRDQRFANSFGRRAAMPALPEAIRSRDRLVNAALRHLRSLGWTIEAPVVKPDEPDFDPDAEISDDERDHEETGPDGDARTYDPESGEKVEAVIFGCPNHPDFTTYSPTDLQAHLVQDAVDRQNAEVTEDDLDFARDTLGANASEDSIQDLAHERNAREDASKIELVDQPAEPDRLTRLQEGTYDAGF